MQKSLIYGTLLGDAWIWRDKRNYYNFRFSQSNKEYAKWKAELIGLPYKSYNMHRFDKRTKKYYDSLTIVLKLSSIEKKKLYNIFYNPKKIVTKEILNELDNQGVAIWFMDDGNTYYNSNNCHITLSTNGFTKEECELIINWFKEKYNINFRFTGKAMRIVSKKECEIFMSFIEEYIPECMKYKKLSETIKRYYNNLTDEKRNRSRYKA